VKHRNRVDRTELLATILDECNRVFSELNVVTDHWDTNGSDRRSSLSSLLREEGI
jgi:hypothetical protein